jgi:dienelactone hydrolase
VWPALYHGAPPLFLKESINVGQFSVKNGQYIDPNGNIFVARGFNMGPEQMDEVSANVDKLFHGANFIRFATGFVDDPHSISDYVNFANQMAAKGIVVEFEDHPWPLESPKTGDDLQAELNRYSALAAALKDQPYAWFGSMNEPQSDYGAAEAAISTQDKAIYDKIRGAGNNNVILMEAGVGAGNPGSVGAGFGMDPSAFAGMHNVGWDQHFYGWVSGRSTDQSVVDNYLNGSAADGYGVAAAQTITSADGIMPVIIGEFGDSTDGVSIDANAEQVVHAVTSSPYGYAAWHWGSYSGGGDSLTNGNSLTHLGQEVADSIAARAAGGPTPTPTPGPTPTPTPTPASGNEITATSGGSLTDASGNVWTLPGGAVTENGTPVPGGGGTAAFAIADGKLYGQDAASGSWYTYSTQSQAWTSSAAPSLIPGPTQTPGPTPTPTPAGNPGQWQIASVNGMQYMVLLPDGYDPTVKYPTTLYLHQLDNGSFGPGPLQQQIDPWFNTAAFRSAHPSIIVAPLLDQNADMSGQTINFGGVSTQDTAGETNAIAALKQVMGQYSVDPSRVYVTGNSMGGIGTWDMLVKYNAYTGTEGKIFAAGLPLAGADYGQDPAQSAALLKNVPIWAIHGAGDGQVPLSWDQTLYAAEQASGGLMKYTQDPNLGHDVWDTYYPQTGSGSPLSWLYNQKVAGGTPTPVPTPTPTPTPTPGPTPAGEITATSGGSLTDASGNVWTLPNGVVTENGQAVPDGAGTQAFAIVDGKLYGEDAHGGGWYTYSTQTKAWTHSSAPPISPTPTPTPTPTPGPTPTPTPTPIPEGVRDPFNTPFASDSVFNLPLGLGAQWQSNDQLSHADVFINTVGNYNENIWKGTASDPVVTITNNASAGGTPGVFHVHIPAGAMPAAGGDQTFSVDDTTTHTWYSFGGFNWTGPDTATARQGSGESDFGSGLQVDGSNWDQGVGTLREHDLQAGTIDHMLRLELPFNMLKSWDPNSTTNLAPYAWPQTAEDGFAINGNGNPPYPAPSHLVSLLVSPPPR